MAARQRKQGVGLTWGTCTSLIILIIIKYYELKDLYINSENVPEHRSAVAEPGARGDKKFPTPSLDYVNA